VAANRRQGPARYPPSFQSGAFSLGPFVAQFEQAASDYLGIAHAIGVNSGTSALHLALIAAGIGPGDKVMVPSYTFVATAWGVLYVGATPVLCDIERRAQISTLPTPKGGLMLQ
jgi:dTDP-4-amino-4,6-dideoxygalactose transaminase